MTIIVMITIVIMVMTTTTTVIMMTVTMAATTTTAVITGSIAIIITGAGSGTTITGTVLHTIITIVTRRFLSHSDFEQKLRKYCVISHAGCFPEGHWIIAALRSYLTGLQRWMDS